MTAERPTTVLIAALGGEGGGVLADWVVNAARNAGLWVQATSIPGVAQRTGATTYYIEMMSKTDPDRRPVFALTASPGNIDLMVASELLEAGRAVENGYITPDRTTLIASTHRFYAMVEKTATTDGRFDDERIIAAATEMAKQPILRDLKSLAEQAGSIINAVLLGAMARSGALPIPAEMLKQSIIDGGIAVDSNLAGYEAGLNLTEAAETETPPLDAATVLGDRIEAELPAEVREVAAQGVARLVDYQDEAYARLYLDRLKTIADLEAPDIEVTAETARRLALWMAFEDLIRVADLKTRPERMERIRAEVRAAEDQLVHVTEFVKPGVDEWASLMPRWLGAPILALADRTGLRYRLNVGMHVRTTSMTGYLPMRALAKLKGWRRRTLRFHDEQKRIEAWLEAVRRSLAIDNNVALMVARSAKMVRGYSDTHARGVAKHARLMGELDRCLASADPAGAFRPLLDAAITDPEGDSLERLIDARKEAA